VLPAGQGVHEMGPQDAGLEFDTQRAPHRWKPALQTKPQAPALQVATALAGAGQTAQLRPHELTVSTVSLTQVLPHRWKPALQLAPQLVPLQVATPLAGTGQATHELPHDATLVFETQAPLQRCRLCPQPFSAALSSAVCEPSSEANTHPASPAALASKIINIALPNRLIVDSSRGANET
jgi:hypothetical protein